MSSLLSKTHIQKGQEPLSSEKLHHHTRANWIVTQMHLIFQRFKFDGDSPESTELS